MFSSTFSTRRRRGLGEITAQWYPSLATELGPRLPKGCVGLLVKTLGCCSEKPNLKEKGGMGFISLVHPRKATCQRPGLCNHTTVQTQTPACWINAVGSHPKGCHRQDIHVQ